MNFSIQKNKLKDQDFKNKLKQKIEEIIFYWDDKEAKKMAYELEKAIEGETLSNEEKNEYKNLVVKLKFVALSILITQEIIKLFRENMADGLAIKDIDFMRLLKIYLLSFNAWARDDLKKKLIEAIKTNNQVLVTPFLSKTLARKICKISEIIEDYDKSFGRESVAKVKQIEYFDRLNDLTKEEKEKIKKLLEIYEYLKITSVNPRAFEDEITFITDEGQFQEIRDGRLVTLKVPTLEKNPSFSREPGEKIEKISTKSQGVPPKSFEQKYLEEEG